jgi:hypothetical protein
MFANAFPFGEGMTTPQIIICRAGLLRFGAVMDRYAFLYSSFFYPISLATRWKNNLDDARCKKGETATFITEKPHLHSFTDCILYKYQ